MSDHRPDAPRPVTPSRAWRGVGVVAVASGLAVILAELLRSLVRWVTPIAVTRALESSTPTLVPAHAGYTVAPHPVAIVGWLLLAMVLGAVLVALVACSVTRRPGRARLLLLWLGLVLVALVAVGSAQAGEVLLTIERFGGRGGSHVRLFTLPALADAVRWGLLWGGVVVLAAGRLLPDRPPRRAWRVAVPLVVVWVGVLVLLGSATRAASISAQTEVVTRPTPAVAVTDAPAEMAGEAEPSFYGRCEPGMLTMELGGFDAASGRRYLSVTATNDGFACTVAGWPDLAFADADGNAVRPDRVDGVSFGGFGGTPEPVLLESGESVRAELTWRGAGAGARTVAEVLLAPWAGAQRTHLPIDLDLEDGAELRVSAWFPSDAGSAPDGSG